MLAHLLLLTATPTEDLRQRGIDAANAGHLRDALRLFRKAAKVSPDDSSSHNDICVAALRLGDLQQAKRECELAIALDASNSVARENLGLVMTSLKAAGHASSSSSSSSSSADTRGTTPADASSARGGDRTCPADRAGRARCALELLDVHQQPSAATAALCDSGAAVRVIVDAAAVAADRLPPDTLLQAKAALRVCGAVVLTRAFSAQHTAALRDEQEALLEEHLASRDLLVKPNTTLTAERSAHRFEVKFSLRHHIERSRGERGGDGGRSGGGSSGRGSVFSAATLQSGILTDVLSSTFGIESPSAELEIDTISHVTSLPGAPTQHWHRDTTRMRSKGVLSSAHCLTLFAPTHDVELTHGPTELLLGSHLGCEPRERRTISVPEDDKGGSWSFEGECPHVVAHRPWKATAKAGAAILFDSRLLHRGGPNRSERRRPQLYITWARQWFTDRVNFAEAQSKSLDALSPELQHLLSRIDAREYVERLEEELVARGVDLESLRTERSRSFQAS